MKSYLYFILISSLLLIVSCSSKKLIVEPTSDNTFWEQGREYVHLSTDRVELNMCHERTIGRTLVFYIEIINLDTTTIDVEPASFYYSYKDTTGQINEYNITAKDPESEIERIDKLIQEEKDSYAATALVDGVAALAGAVAGIVDLFFSDDDDEEYKEEEDSGYDSAQVRYDHEQKLSNLETERSYWVNDALRRSMLSWDEHCGGFVEFVTSGNTEIITIHVPVGGSDLCCDFTQKWITL